MQIPWELLLMPVIGGLIGWLTNVVAIKMLFWPKTPITIFGWEYLGLLPKRKGDLASSLGQAVDENLLPIDEVLKHIETNGYQEHIVKAITVHVDERLHEVLPRILPENIKSLIREFVRDIVAREAERGVAEVASSTMDKLKEEAKLGEMVERRIQTFDLDELENFIKGIAKQELRHIELLGAVLGLLIGVFQSLLIFWRFSRIMS